MAEQTIEQRLEVETGANFQVGNAAGSINIRGEQTGVLCVRATLRGSEEEIANTQVEIDQRGNGVEAQVRGHGRQCSVDFDVIVPRDCKVEARSASGHIDVEGLQAAIEANTASGATTLRDMVGDCTVHSASGEVLAERVHGTLVCGNASGGVEVRDSSLLSFDIATVSGGVVVESTLKAPGRYDVKTVSADITLKISPSIPATFRLHSLSGTIKSDFPVETERAGLGSTVATLNGGGVQVNVNTTSGALRIVAGAGDGTPEKANGEGAPPTDTTSVLQALERGDLSVEDAMTRLERM